MIVFDEFFFEIVNFIVFKIGGIDIFVNNVGYIFVGGVEEVSCDEV